MEQYAAQGITSTVAMPAVDVMECIVVTPEATLYDGTVQFVALPLYDGELGIAPLHCSMIGRLGYGEMRITSQGNHVERFYVDGGFVQIHRNIVTVLTNRAIPSDKIDQAGAREHLAAAMERPASTDELLAIRERLVSQARGQLWAAAHAHSAARASIPSHAAAGSSH